MSVQEKYSRVLALGQQLKAQNGSVSEENGVLKVSGQVETEYEKNVMWDAIKSIGGANPTDIIADITVRVNDYYTKHIVTGDDTLSKIARHYYGDMMKYPQIFDANRDVLDNPNVIHEGQVLIIPFEK